MKQFKKIVALVMTVAMLASMCVFCVSAAEAETLKMPHAMNQSITVDGIKDAAYENALAIECKDGKNGVVFDILDGKVYLTYDKDYLYAFYEVYDGTVDEVGKYAWEADCAEIFVDFAGGSKGTQYRVDRAGVLSDANGNTGDALTVDFKGAATEMKDGNGYYVEFAVPVPADAGASVGFMGFVNDKATGKYAYIGNGPAYTTIDKTVDLTIPSVAADSITLDGAIDAGYAGSPALLFTVGDGGKDRDAQVLGTGYAVHDGANLYVVVDVVDATVDHAKEGAKPWEADEAELFLDLDADGEGARRQYRIERDGRLTDEVGTPVGEEGCLVDYDGKAVEKADGSGWIAEIKIPTESTNFAMGGFVQDAKTWAVNYFGTNSDVGGFNFTVVDPDIQVVYDAEPVTLTTGASVALMPDGELSVNRDTKGLTYWFRVDGLKEPLTLSCPAMNLTTKHFDPVFIFEEDGVTNKRDELGNKMVERDENGNVVFVSEELATDYNLSTYNHGQDGMRNATWTIDKDGDYLIYIPFKVYSLSHQFQGIDYVTKVTSFSIKNLEVTAANAEATIQPMGIFENKLENYSATLTAGNETVKVAGVYDYMNAAVAPEGSPDRTGNIITSEYYDPNYGYNLNKKLEDGSNDETAIDYTETIETTWQIAYVGDELPETVGGKATSDVIWVTDPKGGDAAIPARNNFLSEAETVTVTFMNGEEEHDVVTVLYGDKITVSRAKKASSDWYTYKFDKWVDAEGNEVDLKNVTETMTVYASFTETFRSEKLPKDIKEGDWYFEAVKWALVNGVMNGVSGTEFAPNGTATRAMIVTILYRLQGSPSVEGMTAHPFTDVEAGQWYADAITWAYNTKVVNGMSATTFAPDGNITREQFATILYRYASEIEKKDVSVPEGTKFDEKYTDVASISSYATDAVLWTNVNGYIGGMTATTIGPKGNATRAQIPTILSRYTAPAAE